MFKLIGFLLPFGLYGFILWVGFRIILGMKQEEKKDKPLLEKLPMGIVSEDTHYHLRILELSETINRYIRDGYRKGVYRPIIFTWLEELDRKLRGLN